MKYSLTICVLFWQYQRVLAESFLSAISQYPQLSNFTNLLTQNPSLAAGLLSGPPSPLVTVLVPSNDAFQNFLASTGQSLTQGFLESAIPYHVLDGQLSGQDFTAPKGITVPSALTGPQYDNRTAGAGLISAAGGPQTGNHDGQVVFIAPDTTKTSFSPRQAGLSSTYVQSGLGHQVNLTVVNGHWDGGSFQIVDGFLTLPQVCTKTISAWGLSSLSASLNKTNLGGFLDTYKNVTCLGPNDQAFLNAGSPDVKANVSTLSTALAFHTIPMPLYSNFLEDGQTFTTLSNDTVRVTLLNGNIYFNDAKVLQLNVLTNNGLMHVLDKVMSPLSTTSAASKAPTATVSITATVTATPSASATSSHTGTGTPSSTTSAPPTQVTGAANPSYRSTGWSLLYAAGFICSYLIFVM